MLKNFEEQTFELTAKEQEEAYDIALLLSARNGNPITAKEIAYLQNQCSPRVPWAEARVRKMINFICRYYLPHLIGTSKGYFITHDVDQLKRAAETLNSRANENKARAAIITNHIDKTYGKH